MLSLLVEGFVQVMIFEIVLLNWSIFDHEWCPPTKFQGLVCLLDIKGQESILMYGIVPLNRLVQRIYWMCCQIKKNELLSGISIGVLKLFWTQKLRFF